MKKICVVTATRAEFSALLPLIKKIQNDDAFQLQIVATGMHLSPEFGLTYREIEENGFVIDEKVEMLLSSDTPVGIAKSMGLMSIGIADAFFRLQPDMLVILGDRYEMIPVASCANLFHIPITHISGGEITEGAIDDNFRHVLTKLSHLHFTSTEGHRNRVIQMGEMPERVFSVGELGIENLKNLNLLSIDILAREIEFNLDTDYCVCTFHPVTLEKNTAAVQFQSLLDALETQQNLKVIFTKCNADTGGRIVNQMIDDVVAQNSERYIAFTSMGVLRYLSAVQSCQFVIGNSSSGLLEAPSFHVPTVNIGDRQKGRTRGKTVIDCLPTTEDIANAIDLARTLGFRQSIANETNPYGDGVTSVKMIDILKQFLYRDTIDVQKKFYDLPALPM